MSKTQGADVVSLADVRAERERQRQLDERMEGRGLFEPVVPAEEDR